MYVLKLHDKLYNEEVCWMRGAHFADTCIHCWRNELFRSKNEAMEYAIYLITNNFVREGITINDFTIEEVKA